MTSPSNPRESPAVASRSAGRFAAFGSRNFTLLWSSLVASNIGTWMQNVALGWWVVHVNQSPLAVGLLGASQAIPMILLPAIGGATADRFNRLTLLKCTQTAMAVLAALMAVLIGSGHAILWEVLAINSLSAIALSVDSPTRQAFVPDLVDRPALMSAISLQSTAYSGASAIGPAIAGILIPLVGIAGCLYINAASYLIVLVALFVMNVPYRPRTDLRSVWSEMGSGFRYIWNTRLVLALLGFTTITSLFGRAYIVLLPVFAKTILDTGATGFGGLQAMPGVGTIIGGLGLAALGDVKRKGMLMLIVCAGFLALVFGFSLSRNYPLSLLLLLGTGVTSTMLQATTMTIIQLEVPAQMRGRVMSINTIATIGMSSFSGLLIGAAATQVGTPDAIALGILVVALATAAIYIAQPDIRRYQASRHPIALRA